MSRNLLLLLIASIALASAQSIPNAVPAAVEPNTTTTTTTTPVPTTTAKITTTPPTTTTPATTTPKTPITTTPVPSPTAPPTPAPVPKPDSFSGNVTDVNGTCINVRFSVQIDIKYNNTNNTELETGFTIPVNASIDSDHSFCNSSKSHGLEAISISFVNEEHTSAHLILTFNGTEGKVYVQELELSFNLTKELFPQYKDPQKYGSLVSATKGDLSLFNVASDHSYVCSNAQTATLEAEGLNEIQIDFLDSKVEAYIGTKNKGQFDSEIDCKSTEISDVVPIAVGAALAGLVVIVLIAYFIGRRRSRRLAYQSV